MTVPSSLSVLPLVIDLFGVAGDHLAGHLADDFQHAAVVVDRVGRVFRRITRWIVRHIREVVLLNPGHLGQIDVVEEELNVFVIEKVSSPRRDSLLRHLLARSSGLTVQ